MVNNAKKWLAVIISYNQPENLIALLKDLERESNSRNILLEVRVYDNASNIDLAESITFIQENGWRFTRMSVHYNKQQTWRLINHVYQELKNIHQDTMLAFLPQNVRLCQMFFNRAQNLWDRINDPRKLTLTIMVDAQRENASCWTGFRPRKKDGFSKIQWVDSVFVAQFSYLRALDFKVPPISATRWEKKPDLSSGVGQKISVKLHKAGYGLYRVENSLVENGLGTVPNYFKTVRFIDKLITAKNNNENFSIIGQNSQRTINNIDNKIRITYKCPIVASLATIPGREKSLARTVTSLLSQVDRLNIYLNGFTAIPAFLYAPRIHIVHSLEHGDRGDSGKFWWCQSVSDTYYLTCDDDIIYPPDYVFRMVSAIEYYKREAIVGIHGITMLSKIQSYYRDRKVIHTSKPLERDQPVHLVGTGCAGWHSSTLDISMDQLKIPNMADIWLGVICQKNKVPIVCLARPSNWLKVQKVPNTIFSRFRRRDENQTQIVNTISLWQTFVPTNHFTTFPTLLKNRMNGDISRIHISILIPVGSNRNYLGDALQSCAVQDYPVNNFEVIIINDGCKEITEKKIRMSWNGQCILRYIEIPKSGLSAAVNHGLEIARGEYITILPDDDLIYPQKLKILGKVLDENPEISTVYSLPQYINSKGKKIQTPKSLNDFIIKNLLLTWHDVVSGLKLQIHGTSTMYRTSAMLAVGGWDEYLNTAEEWEFHLRMLKNGFLFLGVPEITTAYRIHSSNKSKYYRRNRKNQMEYIRKKLGLEGINIF